MFEKFSSNKGHYKHTINYNRSHKKIKTFASENSEQKTPPPQYKLLNEENLYIYGRLWQAPRPLPWIPASWCSRFCSSRLLTKGRTHDFLLANRLGQWGDSIWVFPCWPGRNRCHDISGQAGEGHLARKHSGPRSWGQPLANPDSSVVQPGGSLRPAPRPQLVYGWHSLARPAGRGPTKAPDFWPTEIVCNKLCVVLSH